MSCTSIEGWWDVQGLRVVMLWPARRDILGHLLTVLIIHHRNLTSMDFTAVLIATQHRYHRGTWMAVRGWLLRLNACLKNRLPLFHSNTIETSWPEIISMPSHITSLDLAMFWWSTSNSDSILSINHASCQDQVDSFKSATSFKSIQCFSTYISNTEFWQQCCCLCHITISQHYSKCRACIHRSYNFWSGSLPVYWYTNFCSNVQHNQRLQSNSSYLSWQRNRLQDHEYRCSRSSTWTSKFEHGSSKSKILVRNVNLSICRTTYSSWRLASFGCHSW